MRVVFIGSVYFSKKMLEELIRLKVNIVGVCAKKDSRFNADFFDIGKISLTNNIPTIYASDINTKKIYHWIKNKKPDVIFCLGWSRLINKSLLKSNSMGIIGFHPTALPMNRGRHPIIWTLVLGLKKTATTFFFMNENADEGDIISQRTINVTKNENAQSLYGKIISNASIQIKEIINKLRDNTLVRIKQSHKKENFWRKRYAEDGKIDWRMSAENISNLAKALSSPYLGAHFFINEKKIILLKFLLVKVKNKNIEPGKIIFYLKSKPVVKCGDNAICIVKTYPKIKLKIGNYL